EGNGGEGDGEGGGGGASDDPDFRDVSVDLPETFHGGASYRFDTRLTVGVEVELARWGDFEVDGRSVAGYDDASGGGGGVEYSFPKRLGPLPEGTVLRAGARTRTLPQRFGGERVRESALTVGFGQIVGIGASNLDVSFEAGKRGSLGDNGIEEPFVRLGIGLSAFEQWVAIAPDQPEAERE
nr:hypothetical protein [Gemmatimonadota bacterium]